MKKATLVAALAVCFLTGRIEAQGRSNKDLVSALRGGGLVIVMRHASSPAEVPDKSRADAGNTVPERQLDDAGKAGAAAMGMALRTLKIPIGEVLTSPTYRARETARLAGLPNPTPVEALGDGGQSMQGVPETRAAWLRERVRHFPARTNTVIITHMPNIGRAFPAWGAVADGEAIVLGSDGHGGATIVGRIRMDEWPALR
jgi:phosphohistidine phosphatase SixA